MSGACCQKKKSYVWIAAGLAALGVVGCGFLILRRRRAALAGVASGDGELEPCVSEAAKVVEEVVDEMVEAVLESAQDGAASGTADGGEGEGEDAGATDTSATAETDTETADAAEEDPLVKLEKNLSALDDAEDDGEAEDGAAADEAAAIDMGLEFPGVDISKHAAEGALIKFGDLPAALAVTVERTPTSNDTHPTFQALSYWFLDLMVEAEAEMALSGHKVTVVSHNTEIDVSFPVLERAIEYWAAMTEMTQPCVHVPASERDYPTLADLLKWYAEILAMAPPSVRDFPSAVMGRLSNIRDSFDGMVGDLEASFGVDSILEN